MVAHGDIGTSVGRIPSDNLPVFRQREQGRRAGCAGIVAVVCASVFVGIVIAGRDAARPARAGSVIECLSRADGDFDDVHFAA